MDTAGLLSSEGKEEGMFCTAELPMHATGKESHSIPCFLRAEKLFTPSKWVVLMLSHSTTEIMVEKTQIDCQISGA